MSDSSVAFVSPIHESSAGDAPNLLSRIVRESPDAVARAAIVAAAGTLFWLTWARWGDFQLDNGRELYVPLEICAASYCTAISSTRLGHWLPMQRHFCWASSGDYMFCTYLGWRPRSPTLWSCSTSEQWLRGALSALPQRWPCCFKGSNPQNSTTYSLGLMRVL